MAFNLVFGLRMLAMLTLTACAFAQPARAQMIRMDAIPLAKIAPTEPFGRTSSLAPAGPLWIKWQALDEGFTKANQALAQCRADSANCSPALTRLAALVDEALGLEGRQRIGIVNRSVNLAISYTSDERQFGNGANSDVWSSPAVTFASGRGDCEDYAIAKMFALRAAGVAPQDLRLLVTRVPSSGEGHAVLAARNEGEWLILDNRTMTLVNDTSARDLLPLFALDANGVRQYGEPQVTNVASATMPSLSPSPEMYAYEPLWLAM